MKMLGKSVSVTLGVPKSKSDRVAHVDLTFGLG